MDNCNIQSAIDVGAALAGPKILTDVGAESFVIVPEGYALHGLERYQENPSRKRGNVSLDTVESFTAYVKRHADQNATTIFADAEHCHLTAVINDHADNHDGMPNWGDFRARYICPLSDPWGIWVGNNGVPMTQANFAAFIEDNLPDIVGKEDGPDPADMLIVSRNLEARSAVTFAQGTRLQTGDVELSFIEKTDATVNATKGKIAVPENFDIGIPVFRNGTNYRITARLRYRINDGKLSMWYDLLRWKQVKDDAFNNVVKTVQELDLPVFYGAPQGSKGA